MEFSHGLLDFCEEGSPERRRCNCRSATVRPADGRQLAGVVRPRLRSSAGLLAQPPKGVITAAAVICSPLNQAEALASRLLTG
jgi:hypothetical protein